MFEYIQRQLHREHSMYAVCTIHGVGCRQLSALCLSASLFTSHIPHESGWNDMAKLCSVRSLRRRKWQEICLFKDPQPPSSCYHVPPTRIENTLSGLIYWIIEWFRVLRQQLSGPTGQIAVKDGMFLCTCEHFRKTTSHLLVYVYHIFIPDMA